jgi:hypothetical protein
LHIVNQNPRHLFPSRVTIGADKRAALFFKMIEVSNEKPPGRGETEETTRPKSVARRQPPLRAIRKKAIGRDWPRWSTHWFCAGAMLQRRVRLRPFARLPRLSSLSYAYSAIDAQ